ncbi:hypothetical protein KJ925_00525 [Patescibacteria group bacterium]|nr:hypothetical protein [Patescibacteria group bacterium]
MPLWPIVISLLVLGIAVLIYLMIPEVTEGGNGIIWAAAVFLIGYGVVAFVMTRSMPAWGTVSTSSVSQDGLVETEIPDVIVH